VIYELINKQFLKSSTPRYISASHSTATALWMTWLTDQLQVALLILGYHPSTDYSAQGCSNLWTTTSCSVRWSSLSLSRPLSDVAREMEQVELPPRAAVFKQRQNGRRN